MNDFPNNDAHLTDPGPWPDAGETNDEDWQARVETELQAEFPEFDIEYERRARIGNETRCWLAQCRVCGGTLVATGRIKLRNAMRQHIEIERIGVA